MSQDEALIMCQDIICENERQRRLVRALFRKSQVENRHLVIPHQIAYSWCQFCRKSGCGRWQRAAPDVAG